MPSAVTPRLTELYVYLAGSCNLACRHCWIDPRPSSGTPRFLPWTELRRIVEEARELGLAAVKLTGGEPLLHPEAIDIVRGLGSMGLRLRVETNGTLLGEAEARALAEAHSFVAVSLDGPTAELHESLRGQPGCFERARAGLAHLRAAGIRSQIITCLYRRTRDTLPAMIALAREAGAASLKINPVNAMGRSRAMQEQGELLSVRELLEVHAELNERAATDDLSVFLDLPPAFQRLGHIREQGLGCCNVLGILGLLHDGSAGLCGIGEHVEELNFGNLRELSVKQVWEENAVLKTLREGLPQQLGGVCGRCAFRHYCLGKCIAQTYSATGTLLAAFDFCEEAFRQDLFPRTRLVEPRNVAEGSA